MIGTIRRHQTWLWVIIIAATIVTFVVYFMPNMKYGGGFGGSEQSAANLGTINGEPITPEQLQSAEQEGRIFARINSGQWPDNTEERKKQVRQFAEQRLFLNWELEQYHINVTSAAAARYTRMLLGVKPEDNVPADKIMETLDKLAHEGGVTLNDFDNFARHQAGQEYLVALVAMNGKLITPHEAEFFYRRENEPIEAELVAFRATNYYPKAAPTEAELEDFYNKRAADYRLPERIEVNYIAFAASNYAAQATKDLGSNFNDRVESDYLQAGPAAFKDESGKQLSADEAKALIKKRAMQYFELTEARKAANSFMNEMAQGHDDDHPFSPDDLAKLAKTKGLSVKTTEPFDMDSQPKGWNVPQKSLRTLFAMRADDPDDKERSMLYVQSSLVGEEAVYVAGLAKRIPSEVQPFSAVKDKVLADYRQSQGLDAAKATGKRFTEELDAGLQQGKTFDTMCAAQFVRPIKLTPFSLRSNSVPEITNKVEFEQVAEIAGKMQPGQSSPFIPTADGGFVLHIKSRTPVDPSTMERELPSYLARMRNEFQIAAFNAWFSKEFTEYFRPPPGEYGATGGG